MGLVDLLLLADGRAPLGAYAHSFGLEDAVAAGDVHDVGSLAGFAATRVATGGLVDASFVVAVRQRSAAAPSGAPMSWLDEADEEYTARVPAPALRDASRQLGRYLLRLARRTWPDGRLESLVARPLPGWHQPVVLGVVCDVLALEGQEAAEVTLYGLASGIASAGVRLLGLDPVEVHAVQARLAPSLGQTAVAAAAAGGRPLAELPATGAPLLDIRAQHHAADPAGRLFAS